MITLYLICFALGLVLSVLAAFSGLGRLHLGPLHGGHGSLPLGHAHSVHAPGQQGPQMYWLNGFTLPAFLCWFGGAGYLLERYSPILTGFVVLMAAAAGVVAATLIYYVIFKLLLPRERVLTAEDTRMDGVLARVSDEIRDGNRIGEILFSQTGARKHAAARSESGLPIPRGTEVVVLRYARGIAYVCPLADLSAVAGPATSSNPLLKS